MVTKGHKRLGRVIRKLETSVELSSKENRARESEKAYKERIATTKKHESCPQESAVQDLRELATRSKH